MTDDRDPWIDSQRPDPSIGRQRCRAKSSRTGEPCGRWPTRGATVCAAHGARAPQVSAAASERLLDVEVRRTLARLDVGEVDDPFTELSKLAGQVVAWKDALAAKVNELTHLRYEAAGAGTEQLRAEIALFERAMDRCLAVLAAMARLRIDERLVKISERQADHVVSAVDAALAHAGVTGPTRAEAKQVAARHLRSVVS